MQRMLSLPVNQQEREKEDKAALRANAAVLENPPRRRTAAPTASPPHRDPPAAVQPEAPPESSPSEENPGPQTACEESASGEEEATVAKPPPPRPSASSVRRRPVEAEETGEPVKNDPDFEESAIDCSPRWPTPVDVDRLNALRRQPEESELAVPSGPVSVPPPRKPSAFWWLGPFLWINQAFDWTTHYLGPVGRWLRSRPGRNILGWCGVLMMLTGLAWQILLWCGWQ